MGGQVKFWSGATNECRRTLQAATEPTLSGGQTVPLLAVHRPAPAPPPARLLGRLLPRTGPPIGPLSPYRHRSAKIAHRARAGKARRAG